MVVRDILKLSKDEVLTLPNKFKLTFEDNITLEVTRNKIIFSDYAWDLIRAYPNTLITSNLYIDHVLDNGNYTNNTHILLLQEVYRAVIQQYKLITPESKEELLDLIFRTTNKIITVISKYVEEYIASIDILDFINIITDEEIAELTENTEDTYLDINKTYKKVLDILLNSKKFENNNICIALKTGIVSTIQVLQSVVIRGKITEVDGSLLKHGVMSNYTSGLNSLYEYAVESRSAAKSLYYSDNKLSDVMYAARKLEILASVVETIEYSDCGTDQYMKWRINGPVKDGNNNINYKGDLHYMTGKFYLDETDPNNPFLKEITGDDPSLYNKILKIRSPLFCKTINPHKVCHVCFGSLSNNVSRFANLGHLCVSTLFSILGQSILSIKHADFVNIDSKLILNNQTSKYFRTNKDQNIYIFNSHFKDKNLKVIINKDEALGLTELKTIENRNDINPIRISAIGYLDIEFTDGNSTLKDMVHLSHNNKRVNMTLEFLLYLKVKGWKTDSKDNFVFDLSDWDMNKPIFKLQEIEYSYSNNSSMITSIIESCKRDSKQRLTEGTALNTLQTLFQVVNNKLNINLSVLEVIIYSASIAGDGDYSLGRSNNLGRLGYSSKTIQQRSLSSAYAYQGQDKTTFDPSSFNHENRPSSYFDVAIAPEEYIQEIDDRA